MNDQLADDFSTLAITAEENILFLLAESNHALERGGPAWTPAHAKVAHRLVTSVTGKLGMIAAKL